MTSTARFRNISRNNSVRDDDQEPRLQFHKTFLGLVQDPSERVIEILGIGIAKNIGYPGL
jgi:hypothetical protein